MWCTAGAGPRTPSRSIGATLEFVFVKTNFFHGSKIEGVGGLGPPWPPPDSDDGGGVA